MTTALCFHCGATKFGALCPCGTCGGPASGDSDLDIAFSDHYMSVGSLKKFGKIIRQIARQTDDDEVRMWSFLNYVSIYHSSILTVDTPPELVRLVEPILQNIDLRAFEVVNKRPRLDEGPPPQSGRSSSIVVQSVFEATQRRIRGFCRC